MKEKFIKGKYAAAQYTKKKIGIGVSGESAFCYVTPREGEEFSDELRYTIQLMKTSPEMYVLLDTILDTQRKYYGDGMGLHIAMIGLADQIENLLSKARGDK